MALCLGPVARAIEFQGEAPPPASDLALWYRRPARDWGEALPVGDGGLGAMVFGGVDGERISISDDSLWEGEVDAAPNPEARAALPEIRRLLFAGRRADAAALAARSVVAPAGAMGSPEPLCEIRLYQPGVASVSDYLRQLDLHTGIVEVSFQAGGASFRRELFASAAVGAVVIRLESSRAGVIDLDLTLDRASGAVTESYGKIQLLLRGLSPRAARGSGAAPPPPFAAMLLCLPEGGTLGNEGGVMSLRGASGVTILLAPATRPRSRNPESDCTKRLLAASFQSYDSLRLDQIRRHRIAFERAQIELRAPAAAALPMDERLAAYRRGASDPAFEALYFQYARHLLLASSQPGVLPGLWRRAAGERNLPRQVPLALPMNFWPAEPTNLGDRHAPLLELIDSAAQSGRATAQRLYGCRGWTLHAETNSRGATVPPSVAALWPMGAALLCRDPWERYRFGGDKDYLAKRAYPVIKGAAEFLLDFLAQDPRGRLVACPSFAPQTGETGPGYGAALDSEIAGELFRHCMEAERILAVDSDLRDRLADASRRIAPPEINPKTGRLHVWPNLDDEPASAEAKLGPLYAVYPGDQITPRGTPELAAAARKSLEAALAADGAPSMIRAWAVNLWARLGDGERAHDALRGLLAESASNNLLSLDSPTAIDAALGAAAGVAEMLLQSHEGELNLLPALPKAWPEGFIQGLRARGGREVDLVWKGGRLAQASLRCKLGGPCRVRAPLEIDLKDAAKGEVRRLGPGLLEFDARAGGSYEIRPAPQEN